MNTSSKANSGQVVLMVLLTMVVGLTIALSVFLNSLSDTSLTITEEQSEEAFSAAEAGIEDLLYRDIDEAASGTVSVGSDDNLIQAEVAVAELNNLEATVPLNSVVTVQLKDKDNNPYQGDSITVYWTEGAEEGAVNCDAKPAGIIVSIWSSPSSVRYEAYDPADCNTGSSAFKNSSPASGFRSMATITGITTNDTHIRIRPVFNAATIRVEGDGTNDLPRQQIEITSTAAADSGETRALQVTKDVPALPEIFDYVLYSGDSIIKN